MSMIEVDPKLFITCRLCLDEMGQYQIVPKVQMQIKYCFEIDVQPFDGLPQLICKKCESILSQYAGIKQMYQVKQKNLNTIKKNPQEKEENNDELKEKNNQQQQDTVSSTQQVENVNTITSVCKKTNKQKLSLSKKVPSVNMETSANISNDDDITPKKPTSNKNKVKSKIINKTKTENSAWVKIYTKQFVCKICSLSFPEKKHVFNHIKKHDNIITKYSNIFNRHCEIKMNKLDCTFNLTKTDENVVINENNIINSCNSKYYILYSKSRMKSSSESSDDELIRSIGKYKRQRLISDESQTSTLVLEQDNSKNLIDIDKQSQDDNSIVDDDDQKSDSIDCVNIDSDSTSTKSHQTNKLSDIEKPQQTLLYVNRKLINNIISMCYKKYLKRFDNSKNVSKLHSNMDSFLRHKLLSIGTKIIHNKGLNSTGLLRYLERKNLDVNWKQTKSSNSPIIIKTSSVNAKSNDNDNNDSDWKSLNEMDEYVTKDFVDVFENLAQEEISPLFDDRQQLNETSQLNSNENNNDNDISTNKSPINIMEKNKNLPEPIKITDTNTINETSDNAVLLLRTALLESDKQTCKKILNETPVPYPKQLPTKKTVQETQSLLRSPTKAVPMEANRSEASFVNIKEVSHMPVITSTVSLAPLAEDQKQKQTNTTGQIVQSNKKESNLPQIKVKPISELMPNKYTQNNAALVNMAGWTMATTNPNDIVMNSSNSNLVYVANMPQYSNMINEQPLCYPQILCSVSQVRAGEVVESRRPNPNERIQRKGNQEIVHMHTVELPNTKTSSPFRYFQRLLQIHNIVLLNSTTIISYISTNMKCLIKFSLGFQQENNAPVTLCLTLFCEKNVFCIKVRDNASKDIDISKLSANWQWEILKVFKGDIVNKLNLNALKHGLDMSGKVNHFVNLLKAIIFSKDK